MSFKYHYLSEPYNQLEFVIYMSRLHGNVALAGYKIFITQNIAMCNLQSASVDINFSKLYGKSTYRKCGEKTQPTVRSHA